MVAPCVILLLSTYICSLSSAQNQSSSSPVLLPPIQQTSGDGNICTIDSTVNIQMRESIARGIEIFERPCSCGSSRWTRVAYLNMSEASTTCPSSLSLHSTPIRGCGRRSGPGVCDSVLYPVQHAYSRVCGRIIAYQKGTPDAFAEYFNTFGANTIDQVYVDGISLTHGPAGSRSHLWTFAAALNQHSTITVAICSCTRDSENWPHQLPSFVGNNYFCDTGNLGSELSHATYYINNPLWDGIGCASGSSCCQFNTPPWFCKSLPEATTESLEMRLCHGQFPNDEDVIISLVEIFVM